MSETDERLPMLEQTAETATDSPPAEASEETQLDVTATELPSEPEPQAHPQVSVTPETNHTEGNHVAESPPVAPIRAGRVTPPTPPIIPGEKPIKPPRAKSLRSKDGSPLLKAQAVEEVKDADIEAVLVVDNNEPQPYGQTTAPLHVKQDAVQPRKKFDLDYILGHKWILLGIIAVMLLALIILIVGVSVSRPKKLTPTPPPVHDDPTADGLICGEAVGTWELNHTVAVFKGIRYLKPPVGDDRWTYDLEIKDTADCSNDSHVKKFKGPCVQASPKTGYTGTEDCLYLNIWTPSSPDAGLIRPEGQRLPVLVYIHGGFLHYGSGHDEMMDSAANLASELGAVIVSFNYRLNVFGWLALEKLVPGSDKMSGNFGLYDQINALKWVKEYIVNFGGDPNMVTVSGLSSGGTSVIALLTNDDAKATFQRAWISGASSKFDGPKEKTMEVNRDVYLRNIGCTSNSPRHCLLDRTSEELIDAIPWLQYPSWGAMDLVEAPTNGRFIGGVLINDERFVRKAPDEYLREDSASLSIPILIGNNDYETDMYQVVPVSTWTWGQYSDYVRSKYDTFNTSTSDYVLDSYAPELMDSPRLHMARHVSDLRSICPQTFVAELISQNTTAPVYRYVNTAKLPQTLSDKYQAGSTVATHGTEFHMLFHYSDDDSEEFMKTKEQFRAIVKEFMLKGNITGWEHYPTVYNISSSETLSTNKWTTGSCEPWRPFYPDYSWMN